MIYKGLLYIMNLLHMTQQLGQINCALLLILNNPVNPV